MVSGSRWKQKGFRLLERQAWNWHSFPPHSVDLIQEGSVWDLRSEEYSSFLMGRAAKSHSGELGHRERWKAGDNSKRKKEREVAQSCPTLCNLMDCSLPGSSIHGIFQARVLEWVAISFSRGASWPGIKPGFPKLQADAFLCEPPGKLDIYH